MITIKDVIATIESTSAGEVIKIECLIANKLVNKEPFTDVERLNYVTLSAYRIIYVYTNNLTTKETILEGYESSCGNLDIMKELDNDVVNPIHKDLVEMVIESYKLANDILIDNTGESLL